MRRLLYGIGCVIPLGADPLQVHRHFLDLGCKQITYLMPHQTHDSIAGVQERYGPTPCADFSQIKLNVMQSDFSNLLRTSTMHSQAIFEGMPVAQFCRTCPEGQTCRGGYLAHRYSKARGFDNPSVWCADLQKLFGHPRERLGVSIEETLERRRLLAAA